MHGEAYHITVGSAANHLNQQFYSTHRQFDFLPRESTVLQSIFMKQIFKISKAIFWSSGILLPTSTMQHALWLSENIITFLGCN